MNLQEITSNREHWYNLAHKAIDEHLSGNISIEIACSLIRERTIQVKLYDLQKGIFDNGGLAPIRCLIRKKTGEIVSTELFETKHGRLCWKISPEFEDMYDKFIPNDGFQMMNNGLRPETIQLPAKAYMHTNRYGAQSPRVVFSPRNYATGKTFNLKEYNESKRSLTEAAV